MEGKEFAKEKKMIASRIMEIRETVGLTQENMADIMGLSLSAYKKVESGEKQVSSESLKQIREELEVSVDYLLFGEKDDWNMLLEKINACSEEEKEYLMKRLFRYFTAVKKAAPKPNREPDE